MLAGDDFTEAKKQSRLGSAVVLLPLIFALYIVLSVIVASLPPSRTTSDEATAPRYAKYACFPPVALRIAAAPQPRKLHYTKVPKTGSTTVSALLRRYCLRRGLRHIAPRAEMKTLEDVDSVVAEGGTEGLLDATLSHMTYNATMIDEYLLGSQRTSSSVFRIVSVRDPASRLRSSYYYGTRIRRIAEMKNTTSKTAFCCPNLTTDVQRWVEQCRFPPTQVEYSAPAEWDEERRRDVRRVVEHYDHIMVTELMIRSIMTLAPKLGLSLSEMLVVSQKTRHQFDDQLTADQSSELERVIRRRVDGADMAREREFYAAARRRLEAEWMALPEEYRAAERDIQAMTKAVSGNSVCPFRSRDGDVFDKCVDDWVQAHVQHRWQSLC